MNVPGRSRFYVAALFVWAATELAVAQDTFSLVAADPATGEIVSAGASCLDGDRVPGGARIVSTLLPDVGALHTQSYYSADNQSLGERLLSGGASPQFIIDSLVAGDAGAMPGFRQYAGIALTGKTLQTAAYTGESCAPFAGHVRGEDFVIAGNILLDELVIERMRTAFVDAREAGLPLAARAMAALSAVAYAGADRRCLEAGLSSRSAFLRLARPGDDPSALALDLTIEYPRDGVDPIDLLQTAFAASGSGSSVPE